MVWFLKKKRQPAKAAAGQSGPVDGVSYAEDVTRILEFARQKAIDEEVEIGGKVEVVVTDLIDETVYPIHLIAGMIAMEKKYGLFFQSNINDTFRFVRMS